MDQIGSDWIRLDQIESNWFKDNQIGSNYLKLDQTRSNSTQLAILDQISFGLVFSYNYYSSMAKNVGIILGYPKVFYFSDFVNFT